MLNSPDGIKNYLAGLNITYFTKAKQPHKNSFFRPIPRDLMLFRQSELLRWFGISVFEIWIWLLRKLQQNM